MNTCKDCKFWVEQEAQGPKQDNGILKGECRCNPPIATGCFLPKLNMISGDMEPQLIETTVWACTLATYWCGKWEARESECNHEWHEWLDPKEADSLEKCIKCEKIRHKFSVVKEGNDNENEQT